VEKATHDLKYFKLFQRVIFLDFLRMHQEFGFLKISPQSLDSPDVLFQKAKDEGS
jgi:hypothetical protein